MRVEGQGRALRLTVNAGMRQKGPGTMQMAQQEGRDMYDNGSMNNRRDGKETPSIGAAGSSNMLAGQSAATYWQGKLCRWQGEGVF